MSDFFRLWGDAARTTLGLFWMAFWAFGLGYLISSAIQVFVTRSRMRASMREGPRAVGLGTFFGFISSSCSFAALSTTRALFAKGAGIIPSLAFLLASTNLVVELGIVIAIFLSWQFVVGEYVGGILLILAMWALVALTLPQSLLDEARERAREAQGEDDRGDDEPQGSLRERLASRSGWAKVARRYVMEWKMVWKDVTVGFTVAGIIAAFVPPSFFEALFIGSSGGQAGFGEVVLQAMIGPVAAFFTFIGSMGNVPLAAVLYGSGVSFAGVMAFLFSDLVVFPVLRIQARYYGWKMAFYVMGVFLAALVATSVALHYGLGLLDLLPDGSGQTRVVDREMFAFDRTFVLDIGFLLVSAGAVGWTWVRDGSPFRFDGGDWTDKLLFALSLVALGWLAVGGVLAIS